uniref:Si:dkey-181m9.8 n=1 Tax=Astyanax mexicanus TaxID=7994 RepID=A0A8B9REH7_ASTMX
MSLVTPDLEYKTLAECNYAFPTEVLADIKEVETAFPDLQLHVEFYYYPNNDRKKLVNLRGTVPIVYEGNKYNIPVCIWIHETHPQNPPRCYVCPVSSMVINSRSSSVDARGHVRLDCLSNWKTGWSNLSIVLEEMVAAFQRETPLFATPPVRAAKLPPGTKHLPAEWHDHPKTSSTHGSWPQAGSNSAQRKSSHPEMSSSSMSHSASNMLPKSAKDAAEGSGVKRSYTQELLDFGITFGAPDIQSRPPTNPFISSATAPNTNVSNPDDLDNMFKSLQLERVVNMYQLDHRDQDAEYVLREPNRVIAVDDQQVFIQLKKFEGSEVLIPEGVRGEKAEMFRSILSLGGCNFNPADVLEAVQACRDLPSALKYLSHDCPICQEQMSFGKMITMTHCSCTFCESCFKAYFSSVIKEKSIVHAVCPMCNQPDVRGAGRREESMEYFSLLDTQIRHYLDPQTHELFQRKLRDQALQEMPNFRWCAHCSFGLLHEADRLRMDCPNCGKSTCFNCKSPWASQHEGLSCEKFKEWQQLNSPEYQNSRLELLLSRNKIDCPKCRFRFFLSKGGCLHFKCTQCQHEFCGGCSRPFRNGSACNFSAECGTKGLHAHHPRDCLYHLRDWDVARLCSLLQHHGVAHPLIYSQRDGSVLGSQRVVCAVFEHKEMGSPREEPCGRVALPEYNGYCT